MDGPNEIAGFIESVGVPVATALGLGGMLWWLVKFILGSIVEKITEAQWLIRYILTEIVRKSSEDKDEIKAQINELHTIVIMLIDKNQLLASDLIRLDTMIRVKWGLAPDEKRISRNPSSKVK